MLKFIPRILPLLQGFTQTTFAGDPNTGIVITDSDLLSTDSFGPRYCSLPNGTSVFEVATAEETNVNQTQANLAILNASLHGAVSIKIFRHNCLIASSQSINPLMMTDSIRKNIFSATKGVISILAGIAYDKGLLDLDAPIGDYLPVSVLNSWGDAAHRAITARQLLTETAGMTKGLVSEAITVLLDVSLPQEALAQPIIDVPGTVFAYAQRTPDLLAYVVSQAVNQELQTFAQETLFTPLGISQDRFMWFRDRSFNTYGYAWLFLTVDDFARVGLMMQNGGMYGGERIVSRSYIDEASTPSRANGCYGFLFWTNRVSPYNPNIDTCHSPTGFLFNRSWIPSSPRDLFAMSGSPQQKNFMIPSLNMTISWMGVLNDFSPPVDIWYLFFKDLMPAILDDAFEIPGPGTFEEEPSSLNATLEAMELAVLLKDVLPSPTCNILYCNNVVPLGGLFSNVDEVVGMLLRDVGSILGVQRLIDYLIGA